MEFEYPAGLLAIRGLGVISKRVFNKVARLVVETQNFASPVDVSFVWWYGSILS
jgi:hypothetical protein